MKNILKISLFLFALLSNIAMFAQPGDGDNTGSGGGNNLEGGDPPAAAINSKLIILAIVAVLYVLYTFKNRKKVA